MQNREETEGDLKILLGYMGIEILLAIDKGAKNYENIKLFSGLPLSCVKGRIPVLLELHQGGSLRPVLYYCFQLDRHSPEYCC